MNDIFKLTGRKMPYLENEEYLDSLIEHATERAVHQAKIKRWPRLSIMLASAAAVALLAIGFALFNGQNVPVTTSNQGPLDEFLSTLSDEEAAQLPYYEIEEIPEY